MTGPTTEPQPAPTDPPAGGDRPPSGGGGRAMPRWVQRADRGVNDGAGVLLGLIAWSLTMAYLGVGKTRGGLLGVRDLVRAKFLNKGQGGEWLS